MSPVEKGYWIIVVAYGGLLIVSAFTDPFWPYLDKGPLWNMMFQMYGPTFGTLLLLLGTLALMVDRVISLRNGFAGIVFLVLVSLGCLAVTIPQMMHV